MHRDFDDDQPYDAKRAVDDDGKPILVEKSNSLTFRCRIQTSWHECGSS